MKTAGPITDVAGFCRSATHFYDGSPAALCLCLWQDNPKRKTAESAAWLGKCSALGYGIQPAASGQEPLMVQIFLETQHSLAVIRVMGCRMKVESMTTKRSHDMNFNSNSLLTLYSDPTCPNSHRVRFLAAEKKDLAEVIDVLPEDDFPQELLDLNPHGSLPTLVDRDVVLRDAEVMLEYLDERFPSPTLMPLDPVTRAKVRMLMVNLRETWFQQAEILKNPASAEAQKNQARKELRNCLLQIEPMIKSNKYCMSDCFTLVDISLAPVLWRLNLYGVAHNDLGYQFKKYCGRLFKKKSFQDSLSLFEENMEN